MASVERLREVLAADLAKHLHRFHCLGCITGRGGCGGVDDTDETEAERVLEWLGTVDLDTLRRVVEG